jgi:quercetin dioxygenase-like cupin family protein
MAHSGQEFVNAGAGERWVFRTTSEQSGGELLRVDVHFTPGGGPPVAHVHPGYQERFMIAAGRFRFTIDGQAREVREGDELVAEAGQRHGFRNIGEEKGMVTIEFRPGRGMEDLIEVGFNLARDRKLRRGLPSPLQFAVMADEFSDEIGIPGLMRPALAVLAPMGRRLGYRSRYGLPDLPVQS